MANEDVLRATAKLSERFAIEHAALCSRGFLEMSEEKLRQQFSEFTDDEFHHIRNGAWLALYGHSYDEANAAAEAEDAG